VNKKKKKTRLPLRACLLYLLLTSFLATGVTFSRYVAKTSVSDSARAASLGELSITETGDFTADGKLIITPGVALTKKALVQFEGSEAATYIFLEVVLSSEWETADQKTFSVQNGNKELLKWSMADEWTFLTVATADKYVYYLELAPNESLSADILASDGTISVSNAITETEIRNLSAVFINFRATAVQSSGFASPQEAWTALSGK